MVFNFVVRTVMFTQSLRAIGLVKGTASVLICRADNGVWKNLLVCAMK